MRSDVPFGAFLSGGLDSSSIVASMSEISDYPVKTFTIGFNEKVFDESLLAQIVADMFQTEHFRETVIPDNFEESLKRVVFHYDEPFGDSSSIPTGYVSKYAAKKVKMVLTGDGGDELLSGYTSYQGLKFANIYRNCPNIIHNIFETSLKKITPFLSGNLRYKTNRVSNVLSTSKMPFNQRMITKIGFTNVKEIKELTRGIENKIIIEDYFSQILSMCPYKDEFYKLMYLNFKYDLPNGYLVKVDRMTMAFSLEARLPFLDHRLVEFMVKVDKNVKMQGWERKSVLRKTIGKKLPKNILNAPKKGFVVPLREWFKDDRFNDFSDQLVADNVGLNNRIITKIINENKIGQKDNSNFIWELFVLQSIMAR